MTDLPEYEIEEYNTHGKLTNDGYVYVDVRKWMYGFPYSGIIAHQFWEEWLHKHGYYQSKYTPGFWMHIFSPISFYLVVD